MFNAIQDSVILVENGQVKFLNQLAMGLFGITRRTPLLMDVPFLYQFQGMEQGQQREQLTLRELLAMDKKEIK